MTTAQSDGFGGEPPRRVLLALDESEESERAARFVGRFFRRPDVEVFAINVGRSPAPWIPPTSGWGSPVAWYPTYPLTFEEVAPEAPSDPTDDPADDARRHAADWASDAGVEAEPLGEIGDPASAIVAAAETHDVDLIVVGHRERNLLERLFSPSVSGDVVRHAARPVLVVP